MENIKKEDKQYGLIIPKKQLSAPKAINVFGDEDTSDEDDGTDWVRKALKAESEKNKMKKQTKLNMQKALKEDPTIYQYDEVYDNIGAKNQVKTIKVQEKKPRYIQNFLKAAERRKKEQEHRIERMVQKEREAEGTMYADKESFVTSAYRAKLEEFKKMEEEEAKMSRLESIGDVTKQQDMSGFYRHLYKQTVENIEEVEKIPKNAENSNVTLEAENVINNEFSTVANEKHEKKCNVKKSKKSRQYRQRVIETYESDNELQKETESCNTNKSIINIKDKSISSSDIKEPDKKKQKCEIRDIQTNTLSNLILSDENKDDIKDSEKISQDIDDKKFKNKENKENQVESAQKKERSSIWLKRTVGPIFEAALQRYYARKAIRNTGTQ
ncbi:nuclear speckle splicing regulatory protein 1-like [Vespa mandarinia]|uniref:nuclear speckle splicing regulatory protein 1-like n=1 Tax=Vespa mandarinia TaxID=7446 RepID=UPI001608A13E|nr:nuclear speckle splicing regulatory protein 1-like [Vespa mandarinia]